MVKRNKRASLDDLGYILGVIATFAFLLLIMGAWMNGFNENIQQIDDIPDAGKTAVSQIDGLYGGALDNGFLFLTIGLAIGAVIFAMLVVVHPIFFIFYIIMLTIVTVVAGALSNMYQEAAANPTLAPIAAKLMFTTHILNFLPLITAIIGIIIAIVMYKNWQER